MFAETLRCFNLPMLATRQDTYLTLGSPGIKHRGTRIFHYHQPALEHFLTRNICGQKGINTQGKLRLVTIIWNILPEMAQS